MPPIFTEAVGNVTTTLTPVAAFTPNKPILLTRDSATTAFNDILSLTQTNVVWNRIGAVYSNQRKCEAWIGVVTGVPGLSITIAYTGGGISSFAGGQIAQWAELTGNVNVVTAGSTDAGTPTVVATATATPTAATNNLIVACSNRANTFSSGPTSGFTNYATSTGNAKTAYLEIQSASGSAYSTTWTYTPGSSYDTIIFALEATFAPSGTPIQGKTTKFGDISLIDYMQEMSPAFYNQILSSPSPGIIPFGHRLGQLGDFSRAREMISEEQNWLRFFGTRFLKPAQGSIPVPPPVTTELPKSGFIGVGLWKGG